MTKASAPVLIYAQKPYTVFGLPLRLIGLLFAGIGVIGAFMVGLMLKFPVINNFYMPFLLASATLGIIGISRLTKRDHHIETVLTLPSRYWSGAKHTKIFIAGGKERLKKGRR